MTGEARGFHPRVMGALAPFAAWLVGLHLGACAAAPRAQTLAYERLLEPAPIDPTQHISMVVGLRTLESDGPTALEEQPFGSLHYELQPEGAAVALDMGLGYSQDDTSFFPLGGSEGKLRAGVWEFSAGLSKEFHPGVVHPYVGAGASLLVLAGRLTDGLDVQRYDEDDASLGGYLRTGILWEVSPGAQVGIDLRYVHGGELQVGDLRFDGEYVQAGVIFRGAF